MTGTAEITTLTREQPPARAECGAALLAGHCRRAARRSRAAASSAHDAAPAGYAEEGEGAPAKGRRRVWVLRDGAPQAIEVKTGATNGKVTEIVGGELEAGMEVITEAVVGSP